MPAWVILFFTVVGVLMALGLWYARDIPEQTAEEEDAERARNNGFLNHEIW